jgi:hypothetical protein
MREDGQSSTRPAGHVTERGCPEAGRALEVGAVDHHDEVPSRVPVLCPAHWADCTVET